MEIIIVLAAVALLVVFFVAQYNRLIRLNITAEEAWSQIEVQLQRRAAQHEQSTFDAVVAARAKATTASSVADTAAADGLLTQALRGLLAVAEAYPDLKASANFAALQDELATTENKVAFSRQFYNDSVRQLNTAIKTVPTNFFAGFAKVSEREFYEVEDPQDREVPNVKF
jgi:LemA protein